MSWEISHAEGILDEVIDRIILNEVVDYNVRSKICDDLKYVKRLIHKQADAEYCYGGKRS